MTLLEMIVALAILGVAVGVAAVSLRIVRLPHRDDARISIDSARSQAVSTGRPNALFVLKSDQFVSVTALPDGRVIADPSLDIERLTGRAK